MAAQAQELKPKRYFDNQMMVHLIVSFRDICIATAALPLVTLTLCFISAYIFQSEEIHETHCKVYNVIPSISAITGVSPQRYFWRICIALHIGPRFAIAAAYRNFYRAMSTQFLIEQPAVGRRVKTLIDVVFLLNLIEIGALCGVTYVSNRENYPVHERLFITFMVCSLCHMLVTIKLLETIRQHKAMSEAEEFSLRCKKILFGLSIASTIGLILFFLKHRFLCHDMAFSWFAFCEYIIASANMGFHCTTMLDFPTEDFIIANRTDHLRALHREQFVPEAAAAAALERDCTSSSNHSRRRHDSGDSVDSILPLSCRSTPPDDAPRHKQYKKEN